jgi:rhodanese-related sulfurtransferase/membrane protein insertase Oxa1/YidC/SpoIIIJ/phosphohistidine swiveling domain-containing protein
MLAIPSPDLLLNLFASGAQALGLLAVAVGGAWFTKNKYAGDAGRPAGSRWPFRVVLLLLAGVSVSFGMYVLRTNDETNRRLQANLVRKSTEAGKQVGDTSLKTLGFSDQFMHPRAISVEKLVGWIAEGKALNLIDIREPEEVEMGQIPGSWARRYPDLRVQREGLQKEGAETVLLCDSGNRSSELADVFAADGIQCWFMIGGYEKWVAEHRPLVNEAPRSSIRDIPDYPNKKVLLLTEEVERLVREEGAIFVDVRYPEEFGKGALPGAINLTLRKMLSGEIETALRALPNRPVIAPCYDKRSSFFGMVLGLRLQRLGLDFRGRYTVPHEYFVPSAEPAHIAAWNADQAEKTMFSVAVAGFAGQLDGAGRKLGGLLVTVLLAVLLARLLLLPFTWKSDRDQQVLRGLEPRIAGLRAQHQGDPARARREVFLLYRGARLTPLRNLLGSLVQLVLFLVLFAAVDTAAVGHQAPFLWLEGLGASDPLHVLPIAVGAGFLAMLFVIAAKVTRAKVICWCLLAALVAAATWSVSAAVSIYLLISLGLMLAQRALFVRWWRRQQERSSSGPPRAAARLGAAHPVLPLELVANLPAAGRKAQRLACLLRAGFPVPRGFVVCDPAGISDEHGRRAILRAFRRLGAKTVAVRSSGIAEDGESLSHAGEFDSHLMVTRQRVLDSIAQVQGSLRRPHSRAAERQDEGGVLVQAMVPAEHAGVLFTEDPACSGAMLVEMTRGLGDSLVSGQVDPDAYRFGRLSLRSLQQDEAPIDLRPLLELGRRAERLFGRPQDIEWAYARGRFHLLQSRDITCRAQDPADLSNAAALRETERSRLLALAADDASPQTALLEQNELSELLPEPTPLSLALMNELWGKDGSVERAAARLGIPYAVRDDSAPYAVSVFGRLYVNRREERRRFARGIGAVASLQLTKAAGAIEQAWREDFLPRFRREVRRREALDVGQLTLDELIAAITDAREHFVRKTYVEAEVVNLASTFFSNVARRRLKRRGHSPAELLGAIQPTILPRLVARLRVCSEGEVASSLAEFAHRAPHDFELAEPRYSESPDEMRRLLAAARAGADASREPEAPRQKLGRVDRVALETARRFETLKEEAKHEVLRELACLRALLVELGQRLELGDGVFWLLPAEIASSAQRSVTGLSALVASRRAARAAALPIELPASLSFADLETIASPFAYHARGAATIDAADMQGLRVAGTGDVFGRARVLRDPLEIESFADGDVLVARFTDPRWLPLFRRARGIVTEVGGWLSHAAIQAREHRLAAVVGVRGVMTKVRDGDLVCLRADGVVETIQDRRQQVRAGTSQVAVLRAGELAVSRRVVDLSETGLRIESLDGELSIGQSVQVELAGTTGQATVVHRRQGIAGLVLNAPLARAAVHKTAAG